MEANLDALASAKEGIREKRTGIPFYYV